MSRSSRNATVRRPDSAPAQVARLLSLLPYLRQHPHCRVAQVAEVFGVSERQVIRDLRVLWFSGLPGLQMGDYIEVDMEAVEGDGVITVSNADYLPRPLRLHTDEAVALIVALRTLLAIPGSFERDTIERTIAKLEDAANVSPQHTDTVHVQVDAEAVESTATTVNKALADRRRLRMTYWVPARDETTKRDVDPMRLVVSAGRLYLEGWCYQAQDMRLFRLDRVISIEILEAAIDIPDHVHPRDIFEGPYQGSDDDERVTLDVGPSGRWILDYYPYESCEEQENGLARVTLRVHERQWIRRLALRLGDAARIVEPRSLVAEVAAKAQSALQAYN